MATVAEIVKTVVDNVSSLDELKEVIDSLNAVKKALSEKAKESAKEQKKADKAEKAKVGKEYIATLPLGSRVSYVKADGTVITGTLAKSKDGAKTAHIVLDEIPAGSKKADRYVAYDKIVLPTVNKEVA